MFHACAAAAKIITVPMTRNQLPRGSSPSGSKTAATNSTSNRIPVGFNRISDPFQQALRAQCQHKDKDDEKDKVLQLDREQQTR